MKRNLARNVNEFNKKINVQMTTNRAKAGDVGSTLLQGDLTIESIDELAKRIAEQQEYDVDQLIVCEMAKLNEQLELHKNDDKPLFVICHGDAIAVFCVVNLSNNIFCLYKDFLGLQVLENIKETVKSNFGKNVAFKVHKQEKNTEDAKVSQDVLCLKTLETMMVHLKPEKKKYFIENYDDRNKPFFQWIKNGATKLKNELFSLVKEGYYNTVASDIDQLSKDTDFKKALKQFIDSIPLLDQLNDFKAYQDLLEDFVKNEESGVDVDISMIKELERAKEKAFGKIENLNIKTSKGENNDTQVDIVNKYPTQMEKFTKIFEPLINCKVDKKLDETLKEICLKLDLDYDKLKVFFEDKEVTKVEEHATFCDDNIEKIVSALPKYKSNDVDLIQGDKSLDELLSEITLEKSNSVTVKQLTEAYNKVKESYELWSTKDALQINKWAISEKSELDNFNVYEALAVMDRANELVTGCHKLRETQILSILTFLLQRDHGQLAQIQTGEGKTTIVSILAAIKALQGSKVDVVTSNPVLASEGVRDRKLFYGLLGLSAATNNLDENYKSGARECYRADIVYGSIGNFQFDHLRDSFLVLNTRADRPFDMIILDEVDSMIIDNASHIAKLSGPLPGMETLKYVYIKIWQALHKAENVVIQEMQEQMRSKAQGLKELPDENEADWLYNIFKQELQSSIPGKIKDYIKSCNPTKIDVIPSHIREYADKSLEKWMDNAMDAKYSYNEDEQYVIRCKNGEKVIQPVDYANTGMTLKNTIWQYGLHQFLQLKHNLHLTAESLTSCFISNLGYINKYGSRICGLTGTLGSEAEQDLLSSIYNLAYARIPTYKEKRFVEIDGEIVNDDMFNVKVAYDAISQVDEGRASLVICETIKDAKAIQKLLLDENIEIRMFLDEANANVTEQEILPGEVVIATNIAGRGTDFKTSDRLESNRGLHVCVAFLPCNKRVEDQAFGRTARQGNRGTAKLIVKRSEVAKLGVDDDCGDFQELKRIRDLREKERIQQIKEFKVPELKFQDKLFERFSTLYTKLTIRHEGSGEYKYVLDDLKEFWAFWLEKQNFEGSQLADSDKSADKVFKKFEALARETIEGKILFNPYYSILQAEYFISVEENLDRAEQSLHHAIAVSRNPEILHSAYVKLYEIAVERGGAFMDKFKAAVGDVFLMSEVQPDREYKQKAKKHLESARAAFKKELDYIDELFADKEFVNILVMTSDADEALEATTNSDESAKNIFVKHIASRQQLLNLNMSHASELTKQIDESQGGLTLAARKADYFSNMKAESENEKKLKAMLLDSELSELASVGANTVYALRQIHDVGREIVISARTQIAGGLALIATGMCYPPAMPVTTAIGNTMITEGLCDVAIELINRSNDGKFNKAAYVKGKVISYGMALLTMGVKAALQCPKIMNAAKKACRWISTALRKCPYFTRACECLATKFDKLAEWFEKLETLAKLNQLSNADKIMYLEELEQKGDLTKINYLGADNLEHINLLREQQRVGLLTEMSHFDRCVATWKSVAVNVAAGVASRSAETVIMNKVVTPALSAAMSKLKPLIRKHVAESVRNNVDMETLRHNSYEDVQKAIGEIKNSIDYETVRDIFQDTILSMSKHCDNWRIQLAGLAIDQFVSWKKVYEYAASLCAKLNDKLQSALNERGINDKVDELMDKLTDQLTDEVYAHLISATAKTARDVYSVGMAAYANYKREKAEESKCGELNRAFREGGPAGQEQARATCDVIKRPIHIYGEDGRVIVKLGDQYSGDPVRVTYYPPDEDNPTGHYVPYGESESWSAAAGHGDNNDCFFDAVGSQIQRDSHELRRSTVDRMESDPTRYMASHAREVYDDDEDIFVMGGARRQKNPVDGEFYPSFDNRIRAADDTEHKQALADMRNLLNDNKKRFDQFDAKNETDKLRFMRRNKSEPRCSSAPGKTDMMMGVMTVKFKNGRKPFKCIAVSGDEPFGFKGKTIRGYTIIDVGKPRGKVTNVYNGNRPTDVDYNRSCAAQKLMNALSEHMEKYSLEIKGEILMAESWYEPGSAPFHATAVTIEASCPSCTSVLPAATGARHPPDYC